MNIFCRVGGGGVSPVAGLCPPPPEFVFGCVNMFLIVVCICVLFVCLCAAAHQQC